jgi:hypothetical protein
MLRTKIVISASSLLILALLAVGCGSGDSGSGEGELDKATFVKQAEVICKKVSGRITAEVKTLGAEGNRQPGSEAKTGVEVVKRIAIPRFEDELEEIRALGAPSEGKPQVEAFFGSMQKLIDSAKADPQVVIEAAGGPYEETQLAARRIGLSACPVTRVEPG